MPELKEVLGAPLPDNTELVRQSQESQAKGATGIGPNFQSFNESMADYGHGVNIAEIAPKARVKGTLPTPSQFTPWNPAE